jgi:serine/threonine protein kinase
MSHPATPGGPIWGRGPDGNDHADTATDWIGLLQLPGALREAPPDAAFIGQLGRWRVLKKLRGGWGEVYLCVPEDGPRLIFALKSYAWASVHNPTARRAFERECVTGLLISTAFGVLTYGIEVIDGRLFLVMPGAELSVRDKLEQGPLPLEEAIYIGRVVAIALSQAAENVPGLVHGDLKPENVLLVHKVPRVADFGLARFAARQLAGDIVLGTDGYRAPEADDPAAVLAVTADVYSYGVMLTELLLGSPPRRDARVRSPQWWWRWRDPARQALLEFAARCRDPSPAARPADFASVCRAMEQIVPEVDWPLPKEAAVMRALTPIAAAAMGIRDVVIPGGLVRLGSTKWCSTSSHAQPQRVGHGSCGCIRG